MRKLERAPVTGPAPSQAYVGAEPELGSWVSSSSVFTQIQEWGPSSLIKNRMSLPGLSLTLLKISREVAWPLHGLIPLNLGKGGELGLIKDMICFRWLPGLVSSLSPCWGALDSEVLVHSVLGCWCRGKGTKGQFPKCGFFQAAIYLLILGPLGFVTSALHSLLTHVIDPVLWIIH